jgi:diaminopimelate epimerase
MWVRRWAGQMRSAIDGQFYGTSGWSGEFPTIATVSQVRLLKYQAIGNDYLVLDLPGPLDDLVALLPSLCDRHRGLGSDGLLAYDPRAMSVRIFNPDRSEAQKSGNGLRITAAHAVLEHGAPDAFELRTVDRENAVRVLSRDGAEVVTELDIGPPSFRAADLPADFPGEPDHVYLDTPAGRVEAVLVSVGNPHCVVFGQPVTRDRCVELGPHLETHPAFPERTNVQLCEVEDRARVRAEIWERGAGYTLASGTSASAVAAACMRRGLVDDDVSVVMPGGVLEVRRERGGNLVQSGPARRVYRATVDLADFT